MTTTTDHATLFATLYNLVNAARLAQLAFQERPAAPLFVVMRAKEKALDEFLAKHLPDPPATPNLRDTFP